MSPFWLSTGGGSQVTSSCVAVAACTATFWGAPVGTVPREGTGSPHRSGGCTALSGPCGVPGQPSPLPAPPPGLTRFPHEHLLGGAGGPLAHSVVDAHPDLVAPVLAQVWGEKGEWDPPRDGAALPPPGHLAEPPLLGRKGCPQGAAGGDGQRGSSSPHNAGTRRGGSGGHTEGGGGHGVVTYCPARTG